MNGKKKLKFIVSNESRSGKICPRVGGEDTVPPSNAVLCLRNMSIISMSHKCQIDNLKFSTVKRKNIPTLVKMVRITLFNRRIPVGERDQG